MDGKAGINLSPPTSSGGEETEQQQNPDVIAVIPLQSGRNETDSRCRPTNIQTKTISFQEKSAKNDVTPEILPGRNLTRVRTLPNIAKCLLLSTSANNNVLLSPRPSTEPALLCNPSIEDVKEKFFSNGPPFNTDNIATCGVHQHHDVEPNLIDSVQENPTLIPEQESSFSIDHCIKGVLQSVSGCIPSAISDFCHSSDSASNIFKSDGTAGTFYSRDAPIGKANIPQQNSIADSDSGKKKKSITEKSKKNNKTKSRDSSKDSLSVDETTGKKTVALRKSTKRLSFKIPVADEGIPKSLSASHDKKETILSRKRILKNKPIRERSPKKVRSPKEIPAKSSSPTHHSAKKSLTDKQSFSIHLTRRTTVMNNSSNEVSSRDQSVENRILKPSTSKNKSIASRGRSGANKALSNKSIRDDQIRIAKSQPLTNVTSKTPKGSLTYGSTCKKSISNKSVKDNDIHKESVSSFSSTERVFKKQTSSGKRQHSKQRSLKQSSKGTRKDEASKLPPTEDVCNKGSLIIRNKINSSKARENRENSRDRVSAERRELSKAASQPINQFDSSSYSSRGAVPKSVSETNHRRSETLKNNTLVTDKIQSRAQKSNPNKPIKEDKLQMRNAVHNSTIDGITLKHSFRELEVLSKRHLSTRSSHGDTSEGSQILGRHKHKSDRVVSTASGRLYMSRSRKNITPLKIPSKDKRNMNDSSSSEPQSSIKRRSGMSSKEIPEAGNFSNVAPSKTTRNIKSSPKVPSRSTPHPSIEVIVKPKVSANAETKIKEIHSSDSSEDSTNKCLLSVCRPSTDVKVKSKPSFPSGLTMKQINRKLSSKEYLPKVESSREKLRKIFSASDKEAKDETMDKKSEDEIIKKHDSKDRAGKHQLKSTVNSEEKQKTAISGKADGRKSTSDQSNNKVRKKRLRKQKRLRSRFTKPHRTATCCGGRTQNISAKHHKRPPTRPSGGNRKPKVDGMPSVKVNKEILTIHRSKKVRPPSQSKESSLERRLSSELDDSDSDYESSDSSETNVAIIRNRRVVHPNVPWKREKHIVQVPNQVNPGPILYEKSSIKLVPVEGYNFGVIYPLDTSAPAPVRRSISSSIAKDSRRARTVSQLDEKPILYYETVNENFYQSPRSQSIVGHDLIAPQAPSGRVPLLARQKCLAHDRPSGPSKHNVRVRSPLPCICRRPRRVLMREVPERFDPSAATRTENYAIGYQFRDIPADAPRRRSEDYIKEFLYDLGKSILPPDRYRGKLLSQNITPSSNFRSRLSNTIQGSAKLVPNKDNR